MTPRRSSFDAVNILELTRAVDGPRDSHGAAENQRPVLRDGLIYKYIPLRVRARGRGGHGK